MTHPAAESSRSPLAMEMIDASIGSLMDTEAVVLEGINWSVAAGDYWAIGGLQGSGKSDLTHTAAGIMGPVRGSYRVFGQELDAGFEQELLALRLRLGLVFDGGRLLNHLTILENIALPIRYHKNISVPEAVSEAQALLELTGLSAWADRAPSAMRRNWQQRIGLARALALKPEILLLDSPLSGLDPRDAAWWLDLLDQLSAGHSIVDGRPMTLAVTGDNLRPWSGRARQFAVLKNKTFVPLGNRSELLAHGEPLLQELLRTDAVNT